MESSNEDQNITPADTSMNQSHTPPTVQSSVNPPTEHSTVAGPLVSSSLSYSITPISGPLFEMSTQGLLHRYLNEPRREVLGIETSRREEASTDEASTQDPHNFDSYSGNVAAMQIRRGDSAQQNTESTTLNLSPMHQGNIRREVQTTFDEPGSQPQPLHRIIAGESQMDSSTLDNQNDTPATSTHLSTHDSESRPENCTICYLPVRTTCHLQPCGHTFDFECIRSWFSSINPRHDNLELLTCPLCRTIIVSIHHNIRSRTQYDTFLIDQHFRGYRPGQTGSRPLPIAPANPLLISPNSRGMHTVNTFGTRPPRFEEFDEDDVELASPMEGMDDWWDDVRDAVAEQEPSALARINESIARQEVRAAEHSNTEENLGNDRSVLRNVEDTRRLRDSRRELFERDESWSSGGLGGDEWLQFEMEMFPPPRSSFARNRSNPES